MKKAKLMKLSLLCSILFMSQLLFAQNNEREINTLISKMTIEEKIGQISQRVLREQNNSLFSDIKAGKIGSFCVINKQICTSEERNKLQKIAIEDSRLGIPIIFGFFIWSEVPKILTLLGAALVIASSLIIFMRENKLKKQIITTRT